MKNSRTDYESEAHHSNVPDPSRDHSVRYSGSWSREMMEAYALDDPDLVALIGSAEDLQDMMNSMDIHELAHFLEMDDPSPGRRRNRNHKSDTEAAAHKAYKTHHWGIPAGRIIEYDDPRLPDHMTAMGELIGFGIIQVDKDGNWDQEALDANAAWADKDYPPNDAPDIPIVRVPRSTSNLLSFTPKTQALYACLTDDTLKRLKKRYINPRDGWVDLRAQAKAWGGKRNRRISYPANVPVQVLGEAAFVIYKTEKGAPGISEYGVDGESEYIHPFGDEGGHRPLLTIAPDGALWLVGGDYVVPPGGVGN